MCQRKVRYGSLNAHIDRDCKDITPPSNTANSWSKIMGTGKNGQNKGKHKYVTRSSRIPPLGAERPGTHRKTGSDSDDEYPLPISTYTTLKDKQLKDMLTQQNLPLTGDRAIWEHRHQRYTLRPLSSPNKRLIYL
jgi:E3 ubiquitin-protein ligase RAD18